MIKHTLYFITALFIIVLLNAQTLYSQNRLEAKRIHSIVRHTIYSGEDDNYSLNSSSTYFYQEDEPELIDSIVINTESVYIDSTVTSTTVDNYESTSYFENGFYHYMYISDTGTGYHLIRDANHRLISNTTTQPNGDSCQYNRIYNQNGRLDSLIVTKTYEQHLKIGLYHLSYVNQNVMYPRSIEYNYILDGVFHTSYLYLIDYAQGHPENPVFLKWDELTLYDDSYIYLTMFINPIYQVLSCTYYDYNEWYQINSDGAQYRFDHEGYLIYYYNMFDDPGSLSSEIETAQYIWENITSTEDNIAISLNSTIKAYPNPFSNNLTISIVSKDNSLSDISIYNIKGQLIRSWKDSKASELVWNGKDNANHPVSNGIYLIKSRQGVSTSVIKTIKIK